MGSICGLVSRALGGNWKSWPEKVVSSSATWFVHLELQRSVKKFRGEWYRLSAWCPKWLLEAEWMLLDGGYHARNTLLYDI